ncbi:unnamed protein product [Closterium sp. Yama58-4]|nr:unnamed protein product [Closterium sp. Yama58-4]
MREVRRGVGRGRGCVVEGIGCGGVWESECFSNRVGTECQHVASALPDSLPPHPPSRPFPFPAFPVPPPPLGAHPLRLANRVRTLCQHISATLPQAPTFLTDYCHTLLALLTVPDYALSIANTKTLRELITFFMSRLELAAGVPTTTTTPGALLPPASASATVSSLEAASAVLALTRCAAGGASLKVQQQCDMAASFTRIFTHLSDDGRLARKLLACGATFLAVCGVGLAASGELTGLLGALRGFVVRTWHCTRDGNVMEGLVLSARMLVRLTVGGQLHDSDGEVFEGEDGEEESLWAAARRSTGGGQGSSSEGQSEVQREVLLLVVKELSRSSSAGGTAGAAASASLLPGWYVGHTSMLGRSFPAMHCFLSYAPHCLPSAARPSPTSATVPSLSPFPLPF